MLICSYTCSDYLFDYLLVTHALKCPIFKGFKKSCGFKSRCRQFLQVLNSFGNKGFGIFYVLIVLITFDYLFILQLYATLLFPYLHLRLLYSYNPYLKHHKYNCYYLPFLYVLKWKMQQLLIPLHFSIWN